MRKKYEIDMTSGSLLKNIIKFSVPLIFTNLLQFLYNVTDMVVAGRFAGANALAAVGATASLFNLLLNFFVGFSTGTRVMASKAYGAKDGNAFGKILHTAIALAIFLGFFIGTLGLVVCRPVLKLMGTPGEVLPEAVLYISIMFCGIPAQTLANFGVSILSSIGDNKRPLYILSFSGIINVSVNLLMVIVFKMGVAGLALATIISQYISATLIITCLLNNDGIYRLFIKRVRIHKAELLEMIRMGIPAGLQGAVFNISNVVIQSSINLFGAAAMAGSSIGTNATEFVGIAMSSIQQAALTATAQNLGANKPERIKKTLTTSAIACVAAGIAVASLMYIMKDLLIGFYTSDPEVVRYAIIKIQFVALPNFIVGISGVYSSVLRGLGYALTPMIVSVVGICGTRLLYVATIFRMFKKFEVLCGCYALSWTVTAVAMAICVGIAFRKLDERLA